MSSELIETERTSAGSPLTTRQQRLLPLQLFRPQVAFAGCGCSRSNLRGCSLHHGQEAANEGNAAGSGATEAPRQSIPLGQKENSTKPNPKQESYAPISNKKIQSGPGLFGQGGPADGSCRGPGCCSQGSSTCRSLPKVQVGSVHQTTHPASSLHFAHLITH